ALGGEILDDLLARLAGFAAGPGGELKPGVRSAITRDLAVLAHDGHEREVVALADLVVVEVVRRRDFEAAAADRLLDLSVGDDRDEAPQKRQYGLFAMQMPVALVFGMHSHGRVAQERLRARSRDHELRRRAVRVFDRASLVVDDLVDEVPEAAFALLGIDFEV